MRADTIVQMSMRAGVPRRAIRAQKCLKKSLCGTPFDPKEEI